MGEKNEFTTVTMGHIVGNGLINVKFETFTVTITVTFTNTVTNTIMNKSKSRCCNGDRKIIKNNKEKDDPG